MASFTSKSNGNWASAGQTTWNETGVPTAGDTVSISGHTITVTGTHIIGTLPSSGVNVINMYSTGALTVASGGNLTIRGCFQGEHGNLTIGSGSTVQYEVPSGLRYWHRTSRNHFDTGKVVISGAPNNSGTLKSIGTGVAYIDANGLLSASLIQAQNAVFSRIGDAVEPMAEPFPDGSNKDFYLRNCLVISGGVVDTVSSIDTNSNFDLSGTKWQGTVGSSCVTLDSSSVPASGKKRHIVECSFDKSIDLYTIIGWTITGTYFADGFTSTSSAGTSGWTLFSGNFIGKTAQGPVIYYANVTNSYIYKAGATNPHFAQMSDARNSVYSGNILEHGGTATDGDGFLIPSPSISLTGTIINNITLPNPSGNTSCTLFSALGNSNYKFIAEHNTYFNNAVGTGPAIAETFTGYSGMLSSFRSNLAWSITGGTEILQDSSTNDAVSGYISNCGYNGRWNVVNNPYDLNNGVITNNQTGFDVSGNPQFVDSTRNLASWGSTQGANGTATGALAVISANPSLISNLVSWVKDGFKVQNAAFSGSAHDGTTIGAMSFASSSSSSGGGTGNLGSLMHIMFPGRQWLVYPGTTGTDKNYSLVGLYSAGSNSGSSGATFIYLDGISSSRTSSFGTLNIVRNISSISTTRTALFGTVQWSGSGGSVTGTGILVNYGDRYYISNNNGGIGGIFRPKSMAFDAGLTTGYSVINGNVPFSSISEDYTRRFKNEIRAYVPTGTNYAIYILDTGGLPVNLTSYTQSVVLVKPNGDNVRIVPNYITNGGDGGMYIQTTGLNMNGKWVMYIELNNWQSDRYRFEIRGN